MADISNPREFFAAALEAVDALSKAKQQLSEDQLKQKEFERSLTSLSRTAEKEKTDTLRTRRSDIESEYNKQLKTADGNLSRAGADRAKLRKKGVAGRVASETAALRSETASLKDQIAGLVNNAGLPAFCRCRLFYLLFSPKGFLEVLFMILMFIFGLVALPSVVAAFIQSSALKVIAFILIDAVLAALYMLIYSRSIGRKHEVVAKCRSLVDRIKFDEKQIGEIEKRIKKDKDDSYYGLGEYDAEISKHTQTKNDLTLRKQEALSRFDNETAAQLKAEIDGRYAEELNAAKEGVARYTASNRALQDRITADELMLNGSFTQYIGSKNMTAEKIQKMAELIDNGTASSVSDAVLKLNQ